MQTFGMIIDYLIKEGQLNGFTLEQQAIFMVELKATIENKREALRDHHKIHPINEFFCMPISYDFEIYGTDKRISIIDNSGFTQDDMYDN